MKHFNNLLNSFHTNLKLVKKLKGGEVVMNQKGFTLIELLIVVSIIMILAAIGMPFYKNYKIEAEKAAIMQEVKQCFASYSLGELENNRCEILHFVDSQSIKFEETTTAGNPCWKIKNMTYSPHDNRIRYKNDKFEVNTYCSNSQVWFEVKYRGDWR